MKKILVSVLAVAAMVACSNEYTMVEAPNTDVIGFTTHVDKATRAAEDITTTNIANFSVYGSVTNSALQSNLILTNEMVSKTGSAWSYENTQHWVPGNSYNFVAIAPYTGNWTYTTGTQAQNGTINFKNDLQNAKGEVDLLFASAARENVAAGAQDEVGLTFDHLLSKVAFKFTNGFAAANNMTLEVYGVKIEDAVSEAKIEVVDGEFGEWAQVGTSTFLRTFGKQAADKAVLKAAEDYKTEHFYLIPQAKNYTITFTIDLYQAGVKVGTYTHTLTPAINFSIGGNYCISATLGENNTGNTAFEPIEFTVDDVNDWVDNGELAIEATTVATANELAAAVAEGGDIRLTNNLTLANDELVVAAGNEVYVDLNGYTLTVASLDPIENNGKMTIANGKVVAGNDVDTRRCIYNYGEMVIENMEFVQTYGAKGAAINNEGTMTIKSATVNSVYYTIWNSGARAVLTIEDGTFNCVGDNTSWQPSSDSVAWCYAVTNLSGAKMVVNGGTFTGNHGVIAAYDNAEVTLNAGTFNCYATMSGHSDWVLYAYDAVIRYNAAKCKLIHGVKAADACCTTEKNGTVVAF